MSLDCFGMTYKYNKHVRSNFFFIALAIIILFGVFLRTPVTDSIRNIDEVIARDVVGTMQARGDFNTDWNIAVPRLPHDFGRFRYNFLLI